MVAVWSFIAPTDDHDGTGGEQESFPNPTDASPPTEDARVMVSFAVDDGSEMKGSYPKSPIADDDDTLPYEGFEAAEQIVLKDEKAREHFLSDVTSRSIIFIYLDINDRKVTSWLKDVAQLFSHKDFIYCHSSCLTTSRTTTSAARTPNSVPKRSHNYTTTPKSHPKPHPTRIAGLMLISFLD